MALYNPITQRFEGPGTMYPGVGAGGGGGTSDGSASLPNIGRPYAMVSPTSVPDYSSLLDQVLRSIPSKAPDMPDFQGLLQQAMNAVPKGMPSFQDVLSQGMSSPLLQSVLGPALQNLLPGEELARRSLMDEFRSAGALGGGAMGVASSRLEGALQGQRGSLISQIISGMLPSIVSGYGQQSQNTLNSSNQLIQAILGSMGPMANLYGEESRNAFQPASLMAQVLQSLRPEMVSGASGGSTQAGMSGGGGGPSLTDPFTFSPESQRVMAANRGVTSPGTSYSGPNAPVNSPYVNPVMQPGYSDLTQYALGQGTNDMGGAGRGTMPPSMGIYGQGTSYSSAPTRTIADTMDFSLLDTLNRMSPGGGWD